MMGFFSRELIAPRHDWKIRFLCGIVSFVMLLIFRYSRVSTGHHTLFIVFFLVLTGASFASAYRLRKKLKDTEKPAEGSVPDTPPEQEWSIAMTGGLAVLAFMAAGAIAVALERLQYHHGFWWTRQGSDDLHLWAGMFFTIASSTACASGIASWRTAPRRGRIPGLLLCVAEFVALGVILFVLGGGLHSHEFAEIGPLLLGICAGSIAALGGVLAARCSRGILKPSTAMLRIWLWPLLVLTLCQLPGVSAGLALYYSLKYFLSALLGPWAIPLQKGSLTWLVPLDQILIMTLLFFGAIHLVHRSRSNDATVFWLCVYTGTATAWILFPDMCHW